MRFKDEHTSFYYTTEAEALAFSEGVEFVNDSALTLKIIPPKGAEHRWRVRVTEQKEVK